MVINAKFLNWLVTAFFAVIIAIVFQQIATSMTEQGIASGGPYNNGAAYPRSISIAIMILVAGQIFVDQFIASNAQKESNLHTIRDLRRPAMLLIIFAVYLGLLKFLGYHLTTTPLIFIIMLICGARSIIKLLFVAILVAFSFAFIFEEFLSVVLPGGIFSFNIPW
ncbi:MAG: tripartite tricarboxylate transporter TctB family protein [Amylibacter sp.]|nr:tripartite tricarboxylate transporter TctB family protein [Amylibacter sp.]|tara:strand:- start:9884 stop:10381 length:498 start_codon:yes stop_codon:yes gene_type:complete